MKTYILYAVHLPLSYLSGIFQSACRSLDGFRYG